VVARAQQPTMPLIGYLDPGTQEAGTSLVAAFRKGLSETGYVEGRNLRIEFRWARDDNARLAELAADLVNRQVRVIFAYGGIGAVAAKAATPSIPIVFSTGGDAVQIGLVASFSRPGANVTGFASMDAELAGKRLGLLRAVVPSASRIAVLVNPAIPDFAAMTGEVKAGAQANNLQIDFFELSSEADFETTFTSLAQKSSDALLVLPSAFFNNHRAQIATLAARHSLPSIYSDRSYADLGGLMGYGPSSTDQFRQAGIYTGRILKGEKPAELPVMRPTKFEFVINLKAARSLGITVPPTLLAIADEVIE
jgi:putative ABC transport system substrate-binding protein